MESFLEWFQIIVEPRLESTETQTKLISSFVITIGLWLLRLLLIWVIDYETKNIDIRYQWKKWLTYLFAGIGLILVGRLWITGIQSVATFLGLVSAGLAIALQAPLTNLAGWLFILVRRPFEVGDRVEVKNHAGDVVDIRLFQFTMLEIGNWVDADQSTGRIVHIPNRYVFDKALFNYTQGFEYIWNEIPILITFESNWEKAKQLLQEIVDRQASHITPAAARQVERASQRYLIKYPTLTPIVYTSVEHSGVLLTVRYLCGARRRRSTTQSIWEDTLRAFAQHEDIEFAYPTQRFYSRDNRPPPGRVIYGKNDGFQEKASPMDNHTTN